jgi:hypothetical protein
LSDIAEEVAREWMRAMRAGDWEAAWRQSDRLPAELVWNGTPLDGRRVRVALMWSVSDWGTSRSVPLRSLAPLLDVPGLAFYSLQQGRAARDPDIERLGLAALSPQTETIADAAAAMREMDLVIAPDAMPVHLAATLGRPTWAMLQHEADWRWMEGRADTPWYPTVRLFRQPSPGDWDGVARALADALRRLSASAGN